MSFILEFSSGLELSHRPFALTYAAGFDRIRCRTLPNDASPLHFLPMNRRFLLLCVDKLAAGYVCAFLHTLRLVCFD